MPMNDRLHSEQGRTLASVNIDDRSDGPTIMALNVMLTVLRELRDFYHLVA